jgi:thiaminase
MLTSRPIDTEQLGNHFTDWLLGKQDLRLKLRALAVLLLLVVLGFYVIKDYHARSVRTASYQRLIQAENKHDYQQAVEAAETFLTHPPVIVADKREEEVLKYYNEALVLWVARQSNIPQAELAAHLARYRQFAVKRP